MAFADRDVTVITATIGHRFLKRALASVEHQSHRSIEHLVVIDGPEFEAAVKASVEGYWGDSGRCRLLTLPSRTGMDGWCSHRIYAALPFLVNTEFVCFLDQDNWFDPHHVEALLSAASRSGCPAAYSLRKVYDQNEKYVCRDDCQSLGTLHESFDAPGQRHIDTNCWLLSTAFACAASAHWLERFHGDRRFAAHVMNVVPELPCSGEHSVNYTAGSRKESASIEYFMDGNRIMVERYPEGLPWSRNVATDEAHRLDGDAGREPKARRELHAGQQGWQGTS